MNRRALAMFIGFAVSGVLFAAPAGAADVSPDIFQVELQQCVRLHVGYRYVPRPTMVQWEVSEHSRSVATGEFVAAAGRGYHFSTVELGRRLTPGLKAMVRLRTTVGRTTFEYTVPRRTGCIAEIMSVTPPPISPTGRFVATPTPVTAPAPAVSPAPPLASTPAPPGSLAFTGNGVLWMVGVGLLLAGLGLWLIAGRPSRARMTRQARQSAEWLYVTLCPTSELARTRQQPEATGALASKRLDPAYQWYRRAPAPEQDAKPASRKIEITLLRTAAPLGDAEPSEHREELALSTR